MVRPHLEYGNVIWGPHYQNDVRIIESVQRRATKSIPELTFLPYQERLRQLQIPSLQYRRNRGDMIYMYKIINDMFRLDSTKIITHVFNRSTRGHTKKLFKKHAVKIARSNSFSQRTTNTWNNLPVNVVEAPTLNEFKNCLDNHWQHLMYQIND